jgi:hypothetical protein
LAINAIFEKLNTIFTNKNINKKIKKKYEAYKHVKHQSPNRKEKRDPKIKYSFLLFSVKYLIVK